MRDMTMLSMMGENFSKEGAKYSGDDWIAHPFDRIRVCGVIDGARSPHAGLKEVAGFPSDQFAARWFKQELLHQLLDHPTAPLAKLVQRINYQYGDMWRDLLQGEGVNYVARKVNAPAAAFAFAMLRDDTLSWVQGADCVLFLVLADHTVIPLAGDQFAEIIPEKKKQMTWIPVQKLLQEGMPVHEVLRRENEVIAHNRGLIYNQHGGIAVLNGEPTLDEVIRADTMDVSAHVGTGAKVIAMSDGCFQLLDDDLELAAMTAVQLIMQNGLDGLQKALLMKSKPYPTDATAVVMEL